MVQNSKNEDKKIICQTCLCIPNKTDTVVPNKKPQSPNHAYKHRLVTDCETKLINIQKIIIHLFTDTKQIGVQELCINFLHGMTNNQKAHKRPFKKKKIH